MNKQVTLNELEIAALVDLIRRSGEALQPLGDKLNLYL